MSRSALRVLYQDAKVLAVHKPAGVAMQGQPFSAGGKAWRALLDDAQKASGASEPLKTVHRLDAGTSGCLLLAKTASAAKQLATQFKTHQIKKTYLAIVGSGPGGWPHGASGDLKARMQTTPTGVELLASAYADASANVPGSQQATASWTCLASSQGGRRFSLVEFRPETGRKHQLRLMASRLLASPIVGDFKYGYSGAPIEGHLLHSSSIEIFTWLKTGKRQTVTVHDPLPDAFQTFAKGINLSLPSDMLNKTSVS